MVVRFGKKGKLSPCYVGAYEILQRVGKDTYKLTLPIDLSSVHLMFHVFMLKKIIDDPRSILPIEGLGVQENLSHEKIPIEILGRQVQKLRNKEVASVEVLWKNHLVDDATWEAVADMESCYPHLF